LPWIVGSRLATLEKVLQTDASASVIDLMRKLNIEYLVLDARYTNLPSGSVDFLFSNGVLQAIPESVLAEIFSEFRRICSARALMSHHIIVGDQYAGRDRAITPLNFLKFSEPVWKLFNNSLHYQNRLRLADYRRLLESAGLVIVKERSDRRACTDLDRIRIAKKFQGYSRDELLITRTWIEVESRDADHTSGAGNGAHQSRASGLA